MDKRTEILLAQRRQQARQAPSPSAGNWWMYHGDPAHTGFVNTGSAISSENVGQGLKVLHTLQLQGPVLAVPAVVDGYVYVGVANNHAASAGNGGAFYKINLVSGAIEQRFTWDIEADQRDTHGFTGMGCTPAVTGGKVYFAAFNGKLYCLDQHTLDLLWVTDLRHADPAHNQPVTNILGTDQENPPAAGWSSPVAVDGKVYVGIGEGENPDLYSFVYCLDAETGNVIWIFCTCQYERGQDNRPNVLPREVVSDPVPAGFSVYEGKPIVKGCSVWSSIAYDAELNRLFCGTGNSQPDGPLPTPGYSNGLLSLAADTGELCGFFQVPPESNYRPSDTDIDVGGSPTIFTRDGTRIVGFGCKNGGYFLLATDTLQLLGWRQMLPYYNSGTQLPTVDPHSASSDLNPEPTNAESNATSGENYSGTFSTAAIHPKSGRLFIGMGGPNYHQPSPGIDFTTTPFMRVMDWYTLADAWPVDRNDPRRYSTCRPPMYTTLGECGLSCPAVVNDVVFCATTKLSLYAFAVDDGRLLWQDVIGWQTGGLNGGYGYCMGPAIWQNYVVAGGLIAGSDGGVLKIYAVRTE